MGAKGELKRKQIMDYLKEFYSTHGYPPTVREIAEAVSLKSTASVHTHLSMLEEQGLIKRDAFNSRAIEIVKKDQQESLFNDILNNNLETLDQSMVSLPIIGHIAAGTPILAEQNIEDYFPIPASYAPRGVSFMLKVHGESMIEAGIFDGDLIMVKQQNTANNGDIVVALIDDSATVKTFYKKGGHIILKPENATMEPFIADNVVIQGKVFGVYRFFK